jgi:hypothetical protein
MYRMKALAISLLLPLVLGLGSCHRGQWKSGSTSLLSTGLVGWQQIDGEEGSWKLQDGVLYTEGGSGWLSTVREYDDFVLSLEYRVSPGGNSGVFVRAPHEGNPAYEGMEIQILDDYADEWSALRPEQYTGSIYDVQAPAERASKPPGEWQEMVIECRGPRVTVGLNGEKVIDTSVDFFPYRFDTHPGLMRHGGYIGLQNHGSRIEFRTIRIRQLPGAESRWE